jgi:VHL beta domain
MGTRRNSAAWLVAFAMAAALGAGQSPAFAGECEVAQDPSPASEQASGINFYNETGYAMRVFWSGFDGFLEPYSDWIQPGEQASFDTYIGHAWFVEINTPDGPVCSGAISASDSEACQMRILYDNGIGYDGGFCDFIP